MYYGDDVFNVALVLETACYCALAVYGIFLLGIALRGRLG
jgi:hypothetical protein